MNSSRPYLIRAIYEWIVDNNCTPHLLVDVEYPNVRVPPGYASDGQLVLNASPNAVRHLQMSNEAVSFEARFGGTPFSLYLPIPAILAIYARENGQGMVFELEPTPGEESMVAELDEELDGDPDHTPDPQPPRPSGGRPSLKVVK